jgi:serine/threonine-protein kinase RsbT
MLLKYTISGGDFANAGNIASALKKTLRQLGTDHSIAKRIVIALYEAEVNVVAHAWSGKVSIEIDSEKVFIAVDDNGPGINDVEKAMEEGFSTASHHVREMGFGAGMGLANMKRNSDRMNICSTPGKGTRVELITYLVQGAGSIRQIKMLQNTEDKNESF